LLTRRMVYTYLAMSYCKGNKFPHCVFTGHGMRRGGP